MFLCKRENILQISDTVLRKRFLKYSVDCTISSLIQKLIHGIASQINIPNYLLRINYIFLYLGLHFNK